MAVIGNIRKRSGLIVIVVGIALAAFVIGDFFKGGSRKITYIGEINSEKISHLEWDAKLKSQTELMLQNFQKANLTSSEQFQARQSTWAILVNEIIMGEEYKELGLVVTLDELSDLLSGENPHPYILQFFKDPKTGQYDPSLVRNFIQNIEQVRPEDRKLWERIREAVYTERLMTKYNNLISKGYYIPKAFAVDNYESAARIAKMRCIALNYNLVADTAINITENDYEAYYEEHINEYEQEATRDIDYIVFDIKPSKEDRLYIKNLTTDIFNELQTVDVNDISYFINRKSDPDTPYDSSWRKEGSLPIQMDSIMFNSEVGTIIPPYEENNAHHFARLLDVQYRPDSMRASHILIAYQGSRSAAEDIVRTNEEAQALADSLLEVVKADPGRFPELALEHSNDPTANEKAGDLDWFADGTMVPAFNSACINGSVGDISIVETPYGIHLIHITGKQIPTKKVRVAIVEIKIEPSSETYENIYTEASKFTAKYNTSELFDKAAVEKGLSPRNAPYVTTMSDRIPGLESARPLVQWAFREDTEKGSVYLADLNSEFKYVVATLKEIREKGTAPIDQVKFKMEKQLQQKKKAEILSDKFHKIISSTQDLIKIAAQLNAKVDTFDNIPYSSNNIPLYGPEPKVIGTAFSLESGQMSNPIIGTNGVYVIVIDEFVEPQPIEDYSMYKLQMENKFNQKVNNGIYRALEENADIEDNRYLFY